MQTGKVTHCFRREGQVVQPVEHHGSGLPIQQWDPTGLPSFVSSNLTIVQLLCVCTCVLVFVCV